MSAEKDIVNYWLNQQGFFTIKDISASGSRNIGILAVKFDDEKISKAMHVEVVCSISGISDSSDSKTIVRISENKFDDKYVEKAVAEYFKTENAKYGKVLILGGVSHQKKESISKEFAGKGIKVFDFEEIMFDVVRDIDTRYYKDDIVRSIQLVKYLLLSNPQRLAKLIEEGNILNAQTRSRSVAGLFEDESITREFAKIGEEKIALLLRHISFKNPEKLAEIIESDILNRKTRKPFMESLLDTDRMKKLHSVHSAKKKTRDKPLNYFFQ